MTSLALVQLLALVQSLLWAVATLLVSCLVAAAVLWQRRLRTDVPGPNPIPLVGNTLECMNMNPVAAMRLARRLYSTYGHTFRVYIGPKLLIFVSRPEDVARVLCDAKINNRDYHMTQAAGYFLGDGLICSRGNKWKSHRKVIAPTFNVKILEGFLEVFNEAGRTLVSNMEETCGRETVIFHTVAAAALDMISETAAGGFPDDFTKQEKQEFMENIERVVQLIEERLTRPWLLKLEPLFWWTRVSRESRKIRDTVNAFVDSMIKHKVDERTKDDGSHPEDGPETVISLLRRKKRRPFFELFLKSAEQGRLTPLDLRSELITLMAAGYETTATTMSFTLALLSLHPEWQRAVHQELDEVFGSGGNEDYHRDVTTADLSDLTVLDRVIKESLRLFPPAPLLLRNIPTDMRLGEEDYKVPAGSCVVCINIFTHRLPESFQDPDKFDPDRFLPENSVNRHPYSYVPFGAGARNCVGGRYAMMQIKTVLATLLRKFTVLPGITREELEDLQLSISVHPVKDITVTLKPRSISLVHG